MVWQLRAPFEPFGSQALSQYSEFNFGDRSAPPGNLSYCWRLGMILENCCELMGVGPFAEAWVRN